MLVTADQVGVNRLVDFASMQLSVNRGLPFDSTGTQYHNFAAPSAAVGGWVEVPAGSWEVIRNTFSDNDYFLKLPDGQRVKLDADDVRVPGIGPSLPFVRLIEIWPAQVRVREKYAAALVALGLVPAGSVSGAVRRAEAEATREAETPSPLATAAGAVGSLSAAVIVVAVVGAAIYFLPRAR